MHRFHTMCPNCEITSEISVNDLHVDVPATGRIGGRASYTCPRCDAHVQVRIDGLVTDLLLEGELDTPTSPHASMPPLTYDDLLDLHELLQHDDWFTLLTGDDRTHDTER